MNRDQSTHLKYPSDGTTDSTVGKIIYMSDYGTNPIDSTEPGAETAESPTAGTVSVPVISQSTSVSEATTEDANLYFYQVLNELSKIQQESAGEVFELGMLSTFAKKIMAFVRTHKTTAIEALHQLITSHEMLDDQVCEILQWLGYMEHPPTFYMRGSLIAHHLSSDSPEVRDSAAIGLDSLGDPRYIQQVKKAMEHEEYKGLKSDLQDLLKDLQEIAMENE